ncbi:hypothetical protein [Micromonospora inyonensis]|uniref:Uncharacterized protein n=1 Tax=Micromonospora inyonensis TaxID=47866 RepID=A0A1C6RS92_9ACTN|nr:hypothetical protein [Micromonospora inyonensis]SCL19901.1 hypothetical protein GA0074694_2855 [Micromonospora inyonensis]
MTRTSRFAVRAIGLAGVLTGDSDGCDCRMDALMFLDTVVSASDVEKQYRYMAR